MNHLSTLLLALSNALLVPDLVAALGLFALALVELGRFLAHVAARRRSKGLLEPLLSGLSDADVGRRRAAASAYLTLDPVPAAPAFALAQLGDKAWLAPVRLLAVEEANLRAERRLARLTLCIRLGPIVGLVGTLIPLGPGLAALAQGDLGTMASHMIVAFNVTVVGLTTGAIGFLLASARRSLDSRDLAQLAFVADTLEALAPRTAPEAA